ncbi:(2Fe-2S)-binding protein, partial [Serratia marcescens]|nr:(2Fe-2S)-binding protein [Serratia marcescens]
YVEQLYRDHFTPCFTPTAPQTVHWPQMPMLADYALRDYARPDNGGIVCHCELVTQREIEAVFDSAVPPECIGGLRRRTRVMMGRCNGFYCSSRVAEMVGDRFGQTLAVGSIDEN